MLQYLDQMAVQVKTVNKNCPIPKRLLHMSKVTVGRALQTGAVRDKRGPLVLEALL